MLNHTIELLAREFRLGSTESRISAIAGDHCGILFLTSRLLELGVTPREQYSIKSIHLTGRQLTKRWRRILETSWNATVHDTYSLSEVLGSAQFCHICNGYHFDPHVVPEIVTVSAHAPCSLHQPGLLVLTTLVPFTQLQPLVRYCTADIFEMEDRNCRDISYIPHGRESHCLFDPEDQDQLLLSGKVLFDCLDEFPEIARAEHFTGMTSTYHQASGLPIAKGKVSQVGEILNVNIKAEVNSQSTIYPEYFEDLQFKIKESLMQESPRLKNKISSGSTMLHVEFVARNTLSKVEKISDLWK